MAGHRGIYLPRSLEYAVPWLLGPAVLLALGALGIPSGKTPSLETIPSTLLSYIVVCLLALVLNATLFWTHVRSQFLTWKTGLRTFLITFLTLTMAFLLIWGAVLALRGQAHFALFVSAPVDSLRTAYLVAVGLVSQIPAYLASGLWKIEDPGIAQIRLQRLTVLRNLPEVLRGRDGYMRDLISALEGLQAASASGPLAEKDVLLLVEWRKAAGVLLVDLKDFEARDVARFAGSIRSRLVTSHNSLKKDG